MTWFTYQPSKIAEWYNLVTDAEMVCGHRFEEKVEQYLVMTLDHYTQSRSLSKIVIATDFLKALETSGMKNVERLRSVGDQCLLLSGLFPEQALRKNVSLDYFIGFGKEAYHLIAMNSNYVFLDAQLFYDLSLNFVGLMDVLNAMRHIKS